MMNIAPPNNSTMNSGSLHPAVGKGNHANAFGEKDAASSGESLLPFSFSLILSKMTNKASQSKEQDSGSSKVESARTSAGEDSLTPHFMLKIGSQIPGQGKGEKSSDAVEGNLLSLVSLLKSGIEQPGSEDLTLDIDLQALLDMLQSGKIGEENQIDTIGSNEAMLFLASLLQGLIASPDEQGGEEAAMTLGDKLLSLNKTDGTNSGNKVLLTVPKELLQGFVLNKNGQPHFALDESVADPDAVALSDSNEIDTAGQLLSSIKTDQISEEPAFRLVRVNTQAAASSPQGALLAAAEGLQKSIPSNAASPDIDAGNAETEETPSPHPLPNQSPMKSAGERPVRDLLLNVQPADADEPVPPQAGAISPDGDPVDPDALTTNKSADALKEALVREDNVKNTILISGKESTQWVPLAGATSPQMSPESGAVLKGVFIPMDRVLQQAGAVLERGAGKVQMTLHPPSLGAVNMEVVVQNNRVELVLTAHHAEVQQLLQANADQLKNALTNQGFQIDQMSVLLRRESFGFNFGGNFHGQEGAGQQPGNGKGFSNGATAPEAEAIIPVRDYGTGNISIFA